MYSYDAENKIIQIDATSNPAVMTYDAFGRRVERGSGTSFGQWEYGPDGQLMVAMSGQSPVKAYVRLPGGAMVDYELVGPGVTGLHLYWHPDFLIIAPQNGAWVAE